MNNELLAQAAKAVIATYRKADEASCDSLAWDRLDDSAFRALEEALAGHEALAAVPVEPVAWMMPWTGHSPSLTTDPSDYPQERDAGLLIPLYAHPAPQPQQADHDVRRILIDVVPGEDGMGEEVYAKSVEDVQNLLTRMGQQIEDLVSRPTATPPRPTAPATQAQAVSRWLPIESAPRDGTSILLLIEGGELPLQDDSLSVSIGAYGVHGGPNEDPTWDFAGWSWHQDCYCRGDGKPVGWMPRPDTTVVAAAAQKEPT